MTEGPDFASLEQESTYSSLPCGLLSMGADFIRPAKKVSHYVMVIGVTSSYPCCVLLVRSKSTGHACIHGERITQKCEQEEATSLGSP